MMKGKGWTIRKLDPEDDMRVDMFWESISLEERVALATMEKYGILNQIKKKLRRRCTCPDCKFSKISYFDPQAKLIDIYINHLETGACSCQRMHRDFSDDDHKEVDYIPNPTCQSLDTLLTTKLSIKGDKICIAPEALTDDFFKIYRQQRYWHMLTPTPNSPCAPFPSEECMKQEDEIERKEKKVEGEGRDKNGGDGKEKEYKRKTTCDECRSRINFEIHVASALEERVTVAQRAKVRELQSKVICDMLLQEEASSKASKRTAGGRAHHHHCEKHKPKSDTKAKRRKAGGNLEGGDGEVPEIPVKSDKSKEVTISESDEEFPEIQMEDAAVILTATQALLTESDVITTVPEDFDSEDWTVVGKKEKKAKGSSSPQASSPEPVPKKPVQNVPVPKPKSTHKSKPPSPPSPPMSVPQVPQNSVSQVPQSKPQPPKSEPKKAYYPPHSQTPPPLSHTPPPLSQQSPHLSSQIPHHPPQQPIQKQPPAQLQYRPVIKVQPPPFSVPQISLPAPLDPPSYSPPVVPQKAPFEPSPFDFPSLPSANKPLKAIQPPPQPKAPTISPSAVREATQVLVNAIKLNSSSAELQTALIESLRTLSIVGESLLDPVCTSGGCGQICCEEESCLSPLNHDEDCQCVYHTSCFSLPMILESTMWQ